MAATGSKHKVREYLTRDTGHVATWYIASRKVNMSIHTSMLKPQRHIQIYDFMMRRKEFEEAGGLILHSSKYMSQDIAK